MKIAIMGGTFDPIHYGHIKTAEKVMEKLQLDRVLFIPSGSPAHKSAQEVTEAEIRYEMIKEAIGGYEKFEISDMEIRREGYTYTYDTLVQLHETYNPSEIIYIIGTDVVAELDTWYKYKEDFKLCKFAVVTRGGYEQDYHNQAIQKMAGLGADIIPVEVPQIDISSSDIRKRVREGQAIEDMLPPKVIEIIKRENLYND